MAYIGGGAQPTTDQEAREENWHQQQAIDELRELVVELLTPEQRDRVLARHVRRGVFCDRDGGLYPCAMVRALTAVEVTA